MRTLFVLAEGQTEEAFIGEVLTAHLGAFNLDVRAVVLMTKRLPSGQRFTGGVSTWKRIERDVRRLLGDSHAVGVTTMLDLYGLPSDFPGQATRPTLPIDAAGHLERAAGECVDDARFIPYLSLHEFEALLLADPEMLARRAGDPRIATVLGATVRECGGPELVDDSPSTAPSKRISMVWPQYAKTIDGPALTAEIGLPRLREACPHFDAWLRVLEAL